MEDSIYEERPLVWEDTKWLSAYPLHAGTVLDYFSNSHFYDMNSINEKVKRRRVQPQDYFATFGPGIEFILDSWQEPHLFVIRKQHRTTATHASVLGFYYVFTGRIYPAPSLQTVLTTRIARCLFSLQDAEHRLQELLGPEAARAARGEEASKPFDMDLHQKASAFAVWDPVRPKSHQAIAVRPNLHHESSLLRQFEKGGRIIRRVVQKFHLAMLGKWEQSMSAELAMQGQSAGQGSMVTASGLTPSLGKLAGGAVGGEQATTSLPPPPPPLPNLGQLEGFRPPPGLPMGGAQSAAPAGDRDLESKPKQGAKVFKLKLGGGKAAGGAGGGMNGSGGAGVSGTSNPT